MFHKLGCTCIFIALYCSKTIQTAERHQSTLAVHNITCFKKTERIKSVECEFHKFAVGRYGVSVRMMLNRNLDKTLQARVTLEMMPKDSIKGIRMLDIKLNACTFLQYLTSNKFLMSLIVEFRRTSNVPTKCPFKGNFLYRMDNFSITDELFPSSWPSFKAAFAVDLFEKNKLFGGWQIEGAITD